MSTFVPRLPRKLDDINLNVQVARLPVPVPKLQDLKNWLHHVNEAYDYTAQAMLVIWPLGLWI